MNELLWKWWEKIPDQESFLTRLTKAVVILWILAGLAGMFAAYRFGEYIQAKRYAQNHTEFIRVTN